MGNNINHEINVIGQKARLNKTITCQIEVTIIFNSECPATIFANNRIDKLKTRAMQEKNSITTRPGAIASGTPFGKNKLKYFIFCIKIPIILIPIKILNAK